MTLHQMLARLGYVAATAMKPELAFHIEMLAELRSLILDCHVSVHSYCEHLRRTSVTNGVHQSDAYIYDNLRVFYPQFSAQMNAMETFSLDPTEIRRTWCPACTESLHRTVTLTVDGNFSCKAKEYVCRNPQQSHWNNGKGEHQSLQVFLLTLLLAYFLPEVDPEEVKLDVAPPPECPDIKASEYADSTAHHKHLRYSGIMGSVCKHHSFYKMVNISSRGEKYIFARRILESVNREPWAGTVIFKYDIWCNFLPYLRNREFIGIPRIACIPIGHSLTHIIKCQYKFFPWLVPGNGLSSGEEVETGWSKLRYLWSKIREMSIGTREDAISDALEHINRLMLEELPEILLRQLDRVTSAQMLAQNDLSELRRLGHQGLGTIIRCPARQH